MGAPRTTTWDLEPHTRAKHEILRRYLQAWTPILSMGGFKQLIYVDGFAGPGRYANGEDGSPVIALKAALAHRDRITADVSFLFIERDVTRAKMLENVVADVDRPKNFHVKVVAGKRFDEAFGEVLDFYVRRHRPLPPTFAFIDPFGWTGVPFQLVKTILSYSSCEVLLNFMYEEINRFIGHPNQEKNLDSLFGTPNWRPIVGIEGAVERRAAIHGLYQSQLSSGAKYVRSFEMRNQNDATDYFLFFASNNLTGLKKMKEAMWKTDEGGAFTFSDATITEQLQLFEPTPDLKARERLIVSRFSGREVSILEVETFVVESTPFRETHYKSVLRDLEKRNALLAPSAKADRRRGTFGDPKMRVRIT
jgi:three-Cys-motif partner protein